MSCAEKRRYLKAAFQQTISRENVIVTVLTTRPAVDMLNPGWDTYYIAK